jgi:two-component system chemotaxis sensor kinase CheA
VDADALRASLRAAFAGDLAEGVRVLEEGLVALEREPPGPAREGRIREVFRVAHGLKGGARAAGLAGVEAACHAMESLLGEARDAGRALGPEDVSALLAGVDALAGLQRALAEDPRAAVGDAGFREVAARIEGRRGAPAPTSSGPPSAPPAPDPAPAPPAPDPAPAPAPRATPLRLTPERLDALATAGGAFAAFSHEADARAARVDELLSQARRARRRLRAAGPADTTLRDDLAALERGLVALRARLELDARGLERRTRRYAADVRALRLVPWTEATAGLDRTARDLARALGKEVRVEFAGEGLDLDRSVVDALRDPLAQLVRNAVDHGLEPPEARATAGKARHGTISLAARVDGERVLVRVRDDGRGVDPEAVAAEARRRGLPVPADPARLHELLFVPGFSTRAEVTEVSGRGVGLDLVAAAVRAMRGEVTVSSAAGRGTTFELSVPTTLYGLRAVLARDAGQTFALPALDVDRVVRLAPDRVAASEGRPVLLGGAPVPLVPLGHALGLSAGGWRIEERRLALVLAAAGRRAALAVTEVLAERELALEPLSGRLEGLALATSVAALPGGDVAVLLAPRAVVDAALGGPAPEPARPRAAARRPRRVLLADDAATTRALARSILEASGWEVLAAPDGEAAWTLLQQQGADAVVSDVEMPRLDGFGLTRAIRGSPRFARLPVILLTALDHPEDRRRGLEAGADAYLVKSTFDQRALLERLAELVPEEP